MKKLFISDTLTNKISYYHILVFMVTLPFDRFYSQLVLVSLLIHTLIHLGQFGISRLPVRTMLLLQSVFLAGVVGAFYAADLSLAFHDLSKQLAILLFPFLLLVNPLPLHKYQDRLLAAFAFTCVVVMLYLYFHAFRVISYHGLPAAELFMPAFLNHNFSEPLGIHASYLGMYAAISLAVLLHFCRRAGKWEFILLAAGILLLSAGIVQLASRAVLISILLFMPIFFLLNRKDGHSWRIWVPAALAVILLAAVAGTGSLNRRYIGELREDLRSRPAEASVTDTRLSRWKVAWQLVTEAPVFGHGSGMETKLLKERYFSLKMYHSYLHELNAHNQYLGMLIRFGFAGILIFLFTLAMGFYLAFRQRHPVFICFMLLLAVVSMGENLLDVNKGIFFYSFFFSFFVAANRATAEGVKSFLYGKA